MSTPYDTEMEARVADVLHHRMEVAMSLADTEQQYEGFVADTSSAQRRRRVAWAVPNVEGARTPEKRRCIAPWRSNAMSSIESAPATIPATSPGTFSRALIPPGRSIWTCSSTSSCSPARSARRSTGARPAHDTRLGSSKTALRPWQTRIQRMPFCAGRISL
jgi:hypothetical protein